MKYANHIGYSDVTPCEVVKVVSENTLEIRYMNAERNPNWQPEIISGGFAGHCVNQNEQQWIITSDPEAPTFRIRKSKSKSPRKNGQWFCANGSRYKLADEPRKYYDYNF